MMVMILIIWDLGEMFCVLSINEGQRRGGKSRGKGTKNQVFWAHRNFIKSISLHHLQSVFHEGNLLQQPHR